MIKKSKEPNEPWVKDWHKRYKKLPEYDQDIVDQLPNDTNDLFELRDKVRNWIKFHGMQTVKAETPEEEDYHESEYYRYVNYEELLTLKFMYVANMRMINEGKSERFVYDKNDNLTMSSVKKYSNLRELYHQLRLHSKSSLLAPMAVHGLSGAIIGHAYDRNRDVNEGDSFWKKNKGKIIGGAIGAGSGYLTGKAFQGKLRNATTNPDMIENNVHKGTLSSTGVQATALIPIASGVSYVINESQKRKRVKKHSKKKDNTNKKLMVAGAATGGIALGNNLIKNELLNFDKDKSNGDKFRKVYDTLEKRATGKYGVDVHRSDFDLNSVLGAHANPTSIDPMSFQDTGNKYIYLGGGGKGNKLTSDVFAHELGHQHHFKKGKGVFGLAHKVDSITRPLSTHMATPMHFINGYHSGRHVGKAEATGGKVNKLVKHKAWAVPVLTQLPTLTAEAGASIKGYDILKKSGYNSGDLKDYKKKMLVAGGTYLGQAALNGAASGVGYYLGKKHAKKKYGKK